MKRYRQLVRNLARETRKKEWEHTRIGPFAAQQGSHAIVHQNSNCSADLESVGSLSIPARMSDISCLNLCLQVLMNFTIRSLMLNINN